MAGNCSGYATYYHFNPSIELDLSRSSISQPRVTRLHEDFVATDNGNVVYSVWNNCFDSSDIYNSITKIDLFAKSIAFASLNYREMGGSSDEVHERMRSFFLRQGVPEDVVNKRGAAMVYLFRDFCADALVRVHGYVIDTWTEEHGQALPLMDALEDYVRLEDTSLLDAAFSNPTIDVPFEVSSVRSVNSYSHDAKLVFETIRSRGLMGNVVFETNGMYIDQMVKSNGEESTIDLTEFMSSLELVIEEV
ncbi:MAG: hypothetical protein IIA87_04750 [Nanoarchaeota archaeon]|nr:hypothetical protein [Nanoarchaeota archaeon]